MNIKHMGHNYITIILPTKDSISVGIENLASTRIVFEISLKQKSYLDNTYLFMAKIWRDSKVTSK